jgi:hypothetical protein
LNQRHGRGVFSREETFMPIFRLVPIARPDDPSWDRAPNHGEIVVRASSSGEARAIAAMEESVAAGARKLQSTTQVIASAFRDPLLYSVIEDESGEFPAAGPIRMVKGTFSFPKPVVGHGD